MSLVTIGVLQGWVSERLNQFMTLSMKAVWDKVMVHAGRSHEKAMPSVNLAGPSSEISHLDLRRAANRSFSAAEEAAEKMSSTWTLKMTVPVGEQHM